jgi:ribonuclease R
VELAQWFVEGLVPIESLEGDRFAYHENVRQIIGQRTRRTYSIGDRVRVLLDRVDPLERKLQFSIVEPVKARVPKREEKKNGKGKGKRGKRR